MNDVARLNTLIAHAVADARGNPSEVQDIIACLAAGIGLAVAVTAAGRSDLANDLCEMASVNLFEATTSQAVRLKTERDRA